MLLNSWTNSSTVSHPFDWIMREILKSKIIPLSCVWLYQAASGRCDAWKRRAASRTGVLLPFAGWRASECCSRQLWTFLQWVLLLWDFLLTVSWYSARLDLFLQQYYDQCFLFLPEKYVEGFSQQNRKISHDQQCLLLVGKINDRCQHSEFNNTATCLPVPCVHMVCISRLCS